MRTLSFHATRVTAASVHDEVHTLSFEVDADGDPRIYLSVMNEQEPGEVRLAWGDGSESRDECTVEVQTATFGTLEPTRTLFRLVLAAPAPECMAGYGQVEITFDPTDPWLDAEGLAEASRALFGAATGDDHLRA